MAALLGSPTPIPGAERSIEREHPLDVVEVVRQVVLGEQVDKQRTAHSRRQLNALERTVARRPLVSAFEVTPAAIGDQFVREPLLGRREVAVEELPGHGLQLGDERLWCHARQPTYR